MTDFETWILDLELGAKFNVELYDTSRLTGFTNVEIVEAIETPNDILVVFLNKGKKIYVKLSEIKYMEER